MKLLVADDEKLLRLTLTDDLSDGGHDVVAVEDGDAALAALARDDFDCVLTDLKMPGADGHAVLHAARERDIDVIIITGAGSVDSAVEAMKQGAYDYLQKPFRNDEVLLLLNRLEEARGLAQEVKSLRQQLSERRGMGQFITRSRRMEDVLEHARAAARTDAGILIVGESGSGKEVLSRAMHEESSRASGAFVPIACGVLAETLLEDELFGHEKGAFTGAVKDRAGRFEQARGGTVFLDDIDDMPLATQVKLLRVLQEHTIERLGGNPEINVDIRVIAASKRDLAELVAEGVFREDLYYRLNIVTLAIPPLRDRREDIPLLAAHFIVRHGQQRQVNISPVALSALKERPWPGNVRELENTILRALALTPDGADELDPRYLLAQTGADLTLTASGESDNDNAPVKRLAQAVEEAERFCIENALTLCDGNRTRTAERLGISRKHLWEKMKKLGIED